MRRDPFGPIPDPSRLLCLALVAIVIAGCGSNSSTSPRPGPISFQKNPCAPGSTVQLAEAQAALLDCSNGGTTVTLTGDGASYLIVPQFASNQPSNTLFPYSLATGNLVAAASSSRRVAEWRAALRATPVNGGLLPRGRPMQAQQALDVALRARARAAAGLTHLVRLTTPTARPSAAIPPPTLGSTRSFQVLSVWSATNPAWKSVTATLDYAGDNLLLYVDQAAPANGFTPGQLQAFGQLFDQTLYPIDTLNFGPPSDVDQNGRVIMLMSPVVNALTPASTCLTQGYIAGFFDEEDFNDASDPHSNQGEIFYSVVPDPNGAASCAHTVTELGQAVPATFMHEVQHLVNFSQHAVLKAGTPASAWLDEGLSIVAEELGSLYYEQKCPPPSCRTDPAQIFPDSSQPFVQDFLFDSYQYALLPDTASLTLHTDDQNGFSWRGGDWALLRYLSDQNGGGFLRALEQGPSDGVTALEAATGQSFPAFFANFGLALYTDSLPGLPRATAPAVDRFVSRNMSQLWARLYATSGGAGSVPLVFPIQVFPVTADTSSAVMDPGTMTYFRLDTPASDSTVSIRFSAPSGQPLSAVLKPQLGVFRLPAGQ